MTEQNEKPAQIARNSPNIYLRGSTWWARVSVAGRECRKSLKTADQKEAAKLAKKWREELWGHEWYGRPLPTKAVPRSPSRAWAAADPRRPAAHLAVHEALRTGRLKRRPCEKCGARKAHAHHDDYDRPLAVRWLCPLHHRAEHKPMAGPLPITEVGW